MKTIVIIPCYCPNERLISLINDLQKVDLTDILIVNDGNEKSFDEIFNKAVSLNCKVISHEKNMGKGAGLKTAFAYILENYKQKVVAVCADCDGQHIVSDIKAVAEMAQQNDGKLIMGCRDFSDKTIPFRSRFGNKFTCEVFKILCGVKVRDTQTGLRGLNSDLMKLFLQTKGNRFEYEMNMLVDAKENDIDLVEVMINTVYIEGNQSSHFNPLKDSFRIYMVFSKFIFSSLFSSVSDLCLFTLFLYLGQCAVIPEPISIVISTIGARVFSAIINFVINKKAVFKVNTSKKTFVKYFILAAAQMSASALLVMLFQLIFHTEILALKIIVDVILFVISFNVQREWVFKK